MNSVSVADSAAPAALPAPVAEASIPNARHFVRSVFRFGIAQALSWIASIVLVVMLPRFLGDVSLGKLGFGLAITAIYGLIWDLGISTFLSKEIARTPGRAGELLANALALRMVLALVAGVAVLGTLAINGADPTTRAVALMLSVRMVLAAVGATIGGTLQGLQQMRTLSITSVVNNFTYAGAAAGALLAGGGVVWVAFANMLGVLAADGVNMADLVRHVRWTRPSWTVCKYLVLGGLPFLVSQAALFVYGQIDTVMLSFMTRDAVVGWYVAAIRVMSVPQVVPSILITVLFPAFAAGAHLPDRYNPIVRRAITLIVLINLPMAVGIGLMPDRIIHVLHYPAAFEHSIIPIVLLAAGIPLIATDMVIFTALNAGDRQKQLAMLGVAAALLNPILNLVAIPYTQAAFGNGAIGAAATTTLTELFMLGVGLRMLRQGTLDRATGTFALRCLLAASLMAAVVMPLRSLPLLIPIAAGAIVYGAASFAFRTLTMSEVRVVFHHLTRQS
ncbi:MAG TPA: flippase [Candidatus Dormibacteraeota bacterium]